MTAEFAGMLSERIVIEQQGRESDALGLQSGDWVRLCACRAGIRLASVGPESEGQALSAMPRLQVTIRRRDGIMVGQRVRWSERVLMVRQLLDDPREKSRVTMFCEEVRA